jgi:phospho-N-acetylmuramoyl-pentapeptide-transferase
MPGIILVPFLAGMALSLLLGWPLILFLRRLKAGQVVSSDAPERHQGKGGTPTMGGLIILGAGLIAGLVAAFFESIRGASPNSLPLLGAAAVAVAFGSIGFLDDLLIVRRGRNLGLKARQKLASQSLFAIAFVICVHSWARPAEIGGTAGMIWLWGAFQVLLIVGMSNAVNLTDGLDGLAAGVTLPIWIVLAILAIYVVPGDHGVAALCAGLAGGTLGYLWFNSHPAQVFMGDTGSLALGGAMAAAAILIHQEWVLLLAAAIPVIEAGSVTAQVISFKTTGRRIFKMSPLHHHFELAGWPETRVVARFVIASVFFCALALWLVLRNA